MILRTIVSLVLVCGLGSFAHAQGIPLYQSLVERVTLTGDWGGLRSSLAAQGIDIGFANYGDTIAVVSGGAKHQTRYADLLEPTVAVDLGTFVGWSNSKFFFRGIGTYGANPIDATGSISAPSNLAADTNTFKVFEAWLQYTLLDDTVAILFGLYAVDTEFDVKETAGVFMNGGFGASLDLSETGVNGPCIFPVSCLGVRVRWQPMPAYYVQAALLDGVAGNPHDPRGTQIRLAADDGALIVTEIGYRSREGRFVKAALGGWVYTATFEDVKDVDMQGNPRRRHGTYGIYGLIEGALFSEAAHPTQGLSAFMRAGFADPNVNQIGYYAGGGLVYSGLIPGRGEDVTGFGVSVGINGQPFKDAQQRAGSPVNAQEVALEWTYRLQLFPWTILQLDMQYIINPGTDPTLGNALALGFRYKVVF